MSLVGDLSPTLERLEALGATMRAITAVQEPFETLAALLSRSDLDPRFQQWRQLSLADMPKVQGRVASGTLADVNEGISVIRSRIDQHAEYAKLRHREFAAAHSAATAEVRASHEARRAANVEVGDKQSAIQRLTYRTDAIAKAHSAASARVGLVSGPAVGFFVGCYNACGGANATFDGAFGRFFWGMLLTAIFAGGLVGVIYSQITPSEAEAVGRDLDSNKAALGEATQQQASAEARVAKAERELAQLEALRAHLPEAPASPSR